MKYQTFDSSCCYAALANMLDDFSLDFEDTDIALAAELPFMLRFDATNNSFAAGFMLQGAPWFDNFLRPRGLRFVERSFSGEAVVSFLSTSNTRVMLAAAIAGGRQALVFDDVRGERYHFISSKWKDSDGAERYMFTAAELYERIDPDHNFLGWIEPAAKKPVDFLEKLYLTLEQIEKLRMSLKKFCSVPREKLALRWAVEPLFRPLLVDIYDMMRLVEETRIVLMLKTLQRQLYSALDTEQDILVPFDCISEQLLDQTLDRYCEIVKTRMRRILKNSRGE